MATMIRLRSPQGVTKVYDPKEFDIGAMLKDGYSRAGDVMIPAHTRAFPQSRKQAEKFTPGEVESAGLTTQTPLQGPLAAAASAFENQRAADAAWLVDALPQAGGLVGGTIGGAGGTVFGLGVGGAPGAIGGAAVGGAGGEALRQTAHNIENALVGLGRKDERPTVAATPATPGEALQDIGIAGATQAAYEAGGRVLVPAARFGGKVVMNAAMASRLKYAPEAANTAIREGIAMTEKGIALLKNKIEQAVGVSRKILGIAGSNGNAIPSGTFIKHVVKNLKAGTADNFLPSGAAQEEAFDQLAHDFLRRNFKPRPTSSAVLAPGARPPTPPSLGPDDFREFTPIELDRLVRIADDEAKPLHALYEAARRGLKVPPLTATQNAERVFLKEFADQGRRILRVITDGITEVAPGRTPMGLEASKKLTQELMQLRDVIAPEVARSPGLAAKVVRRGAVPVASGLAAAALPGGNNTRDFALGATAGLVGASPEMLSHLGLLLSDPLIAATLRQAPRGVGSLFTEPRTSK